MAAALLAIVGLCVWYFRAKEPVITAPPTPERPALVHIRVRATPAEATIEVDGVVRGPAPVSLEMAADTQEHAIRASAPGYVSEARVLRFTSDLDVDLALDKSEPQIDPMTIRSSPAPLPTHYVAPHHVQPGPLLRRSPRPPARRTTTASATLPTTSRAASRHSSRSAFDPPRVKRSAMRLLTS